MVSTRPKAGSIALLYRLCSSPGLRVRGWVTWGMIYERRLTRNYANTPTQNYREHCPDGFWRFIKMARTLDNVVNGLGVSDPQTLFLHDSIRTRVTAQSTSRKTNPKRPVPGSYGPVVFENAFLKGTRFLTLPPPYVSCFRLFKTAVGDQCGEPKIPYIQEGFFGPGMSLMEELR